MQEFTFPEDVAHSVPVHTPRRVVIIAHYSNPNLDSGKSHQVAIQHVAPFVGAREIVGE